VVGQFVLLGLLAVLGAPGLASLPTSLIGWLRVVAGLAGIVLGGWLLLRGFSDLGDNLTPMTRPRSDASLVEGGVYRRLRHPIYAGLIWAAFGWAGMTARLGALLVAILLALFLDAKARREEAWLMDRYPGYADYRRRSKRFLPGIY
jgi:protein-S-isoprenylcysteine O-methyltransferase Ste14